MSSKTDAARRRDAATRAAAHAGWAVLVLGLAGVVSACGEFNPRRELGLIGQGPDEFRVVKQAPLQMPADAATLPTPRPGAPNRVAPNPTLDAQRALTGGAAVGVSAANPAASEAALLRAAGASGADPSIRATVAEEAAEDAEDARLLDAFLGKTPADEEPLDPAEEARRLAEAASRGKNPGLIVPAAPPPTKP